MSGSPTSQGGPARIRAGLRAHESDRTRQVLPERFTQIGVLGQGGTGQVLEVEDAHLGRRVALKRIQPEHADGALAERLERLRIEAEAAARLKHPGIVAVHEFVQDGPTAFIVQELVRGGSLQDRLDASGPLTPREAAQVGRDLARALAAAHAQGVLHRDIKPSNVLLHDEADADGELRPRLVDFGLAKLVDYGPGGLTSQGRIMGTPTFMAPEQALGEHDRIGPRTDVFLLGATLYAALTGRAPFDDPTLVGALTAVRRCRPQPLAAARPGIDRDLAAVVERCMAADPDHRYADAEEVARDLERHLAGERVLARPRRRGGWILAGALLAGLLGTAIVARTRSAQPPALTAPQPSSATPVRSLEPLPARQKRLPSRIVALGRRHGRPVGIWVAAAWIDAARFALASSDGHVRLYRIVNDRAIPSSPWTPSKSIVAENKPVSLARHHRDHLIFGSSGLSLGWYQVKAAKIRSVRRTTRLLPAGEIIGRTLYFASQDHHIHAIDLTNDSPPRRVYVRGNLPVVAMATTPRGELAVLSHNSKRGLLELYRPTPAGLAPPRVRQLPPPVRSMAYHPDGRELIVGTIVGTLHIYDARTLEPGETLARHASSEKRGEVGSLGNVFNLKFLDLKFLAQGRRLLSLSGSPSARQRNNLVLWDFERKHALQRLTFAPGLWSIAVSPDETHAVLGARSGRLELVRFE